MGIPGGDQTAVGEPGIVARGIDDSRGQIVCRMGISRVENRVELGRAPKQSPRGTRNGYGWRCCFPERAYVRIEGSRDGEAIRSKTNKQHTSEIVG
jgi:hypothetical protein